MKTEYRKLFQSLAAKMDKLPMNYIYISHLDEDVQFWRLPCCPDKISDTMSSSFNPTTALGRSAPVFTYQNSGPRTVQISLKLHRDMMDEYNERLADNFMVGKAKKYDDLGQDYTDQLIKALQSIVVPKYNLDNKAVEPPLIALRLSNEVFIKGVLNGDIGIEYELPIRSDGRYAQVALSLTVTEVDPYDASSVFTNGSFRGVVSTLRNEKMGFNANALNSY